MLSAISIWVKQIVMVVIFAAFLDFLLSDSKFFKYIKVFLGLIVMMAIINPLIPLFQRDLKFDQISLDMLNADIDHSVQMSIVNKSENLRKKNYELTIQEYLNQLKQYIVSDINRISLFEVIKVTPSINEDISSDDFGRIMAVVIILREVQSDEQILSKDRITIEAIKIRGSQIDNKLEGKEFHREYEYKKIRQLLNTKYDIPEENIFIDLEA
ncbi:MAG: stage III sporulation protein AF [Tepidanaerobacteraceae bacterium]